MAGMRRIVLYFLTGWITGVSFGNGLPPDRQLIILANTEVPASLDIAARYAEVRGLPEKNICRLDLPEDEHISRSAYDRRLRDPLLTFLREGGFIEQIERDPDRIESGESRWETLTSRVQYIVSIYGVPVHIESTTSELLEKARNKLGFRGTTDAAAVDSELCLLLGGAYELTGPANNPHFMTVSIPPPAENNRFALIATRLDGPSPERVRQMIDDSISAERYGLHGRAYFDARGLTDGGHLIGDYWIREAAERFARQGFEIVLDRGPYLWGESFPIEDPAVYMGWYYEHAVGAWSGEEPSFKPGAPAFHIHSASAKQLRTPDAYWAGPLLARGAAVTAGATAEPYLQFTPHLDILADRMCRGIPYGPAVYMSLSVVSWPITVIGDPLYAPCALPLEQQIENMRADEHPDLPWAYIRQINRMLHSGRLNPALEYARRRLKETESPVLREKIADMYAINDLPEPALNELVKLINEPASEAGAFRAGARAVYLLRALRRTDDVNQVVNELQTQFPDSRYGPWFNRMLNRNASHEAD